MLPFSLYPLSLNQFSILSLISSIIAYSPIIAWVFAGLAAVLFGMISFILSYHWKRFGLEAEVMKRASLLYFSVSGVLLAAMVISLALYLRSI